MLAAVRHLRTAQHAGAGAAADCAAVLELLSGCRLCKYACQVSEAALGQQATSSHSKGVTWIGSGLGMTA
jgi:hypothetical protein